MRLATAGSARPTIGVSVLSPIDVTTATALTDSATRPQSIQSLADVQRLAAADMRDVDALIRRRLTSEVALVNQVAEHIISAGGKRLRPLLVLLAARASGAAETHLHQAAAVIEFIHTATLLHDDVVDESTLRRGRSTANALWGNAASVLVGDYLYSRSFQMMVEIDKAAVMRLLADTTNRIAEGEVLQLMHLNNPDTDEQAYLKVIQCKTAVLFGAATQLGPLLADRGDWEAALYDFGLNLGYAFQIADDMLDYTGDAAALGKNLGDDLAEGKLTLPLILTLERADAGTAAVIRQAVLDGDVNALPQMIAAIHASGSLEACREKALVYAARARAALAVLPASPWRDALAVLVDYSVARDR